MNGKSLMKQHYLRKNIFIVTLNMEDITGAEYAHARKVCKDFEIKNLGEYHDLYHNSYFYLFKAPLVLADVFEPLEIWVLKYTNLILQNFC